MTDFSVLMETWGEATKKKNEEDTLRLLGCDGDLDTSNTILYEGVQRQLEEAFAVPNNLQGRKKVITLDKDGKHSMYDPEQLLNPLILEAIRLMVAEGGTCYVADFDQLALKFSRV